jgi:hypothetical protein
MTAPWRAIGLFLVLTVGLSGIFWVLINATQTVNAAYIVGMMSMPGVAAILAAASGPSVALTGTRDLERPICACRLSHPDCLLPGGIARHLALRIREYRLHAADR